MKFATAADRLRFGKTLLGKPGVWTKGPGSHENGTYCIVTALGTRADRMQEDGTLSERSDADVDYVQQSHAWEYMYRAIVEKTGKQVYTASWNDDPKTTLDQVLSAFDRAIELAEKGPA